MQQQRPRFFLDGVNVNGKIFGPMDNICSSIDFAIATVTLDPSTKILHITSTDSPTDDSVNMIRDKSLSPSPTNLRIGLSALAFVHDDKGETIGPFIKRASTLSTFPNKYSFAGGMYEKTDGTPLQTAIRELSEELLLHDYLPSTDIEQLYHKAKLTDLFVSHPLDNTGNRRFNIILVYTIPVSTATQNRFSLDTYDDKEVFEVLMMDGKTLLKSIVDYDPYGATGWTPNACMVLLRFLSSKYGFEEGLDFCDSSEDNLKAIAMTAMHHTVAPPIEEVKIKKEDTDMGKSAYERLLNHDRKLDISMIGRRTKQDIDLIVKYMLSLPKITDKFYVSFEFVGYLPSGSRNSNQCERHSIFETICDRLKTESASYKITPLRCLDHTFHNPKVYGYKIKIG